MLCTNVENLGSRQREKDFGGQNEFPQRAIESENQAN